MIEASKLNWIDGIMMTFNFRLMRSERMRRAVEACTKSGIGLTAMKTQGGGSVSVSSEAESKWQAASSSWDSPDAQAKLKAVWQEPNIASICSQMPNMTILMSNCCSPGRNSLPRT